MLQRYQLKSHQNIYYQNIIYIVPFIIKLYKPSSKRFGKVTGHRPLVTLGERENINQNAKNQEYGKWKIVCTKFVNTEHSPPFVSNLNSINFKFAVLIIHLTR